MLKSLSHGCGAGGAKEEQALNPRAVWEVADFSPSDQVHTLRTNQRSQELPTRSIAASVSQSSSPTDATAEEDLPHEAVIQVSSCSGKL
jgi:hypothetical protein